MRRKAETVNFVPGGRWDEASVGTNALAIAGRTDAPAMVFSAEHYAEVVHNWVCWAAPVHDPVTGRPLGVIDLSTTRDRTHPIGLATARVMARLIETALPTSRRSPATGLPAPDQPGLTLTLLGTARCGSTASGCSSTVGRPRFSPCWRCTPRGSRSSSCTRCSTATPRSPPPPSRRRSPTSAPLCGASCPRAPTASPCP
ncbi:GAF domain-containing protein [Nocardioides sp. B-3]|uniref:GAF domain-containing protein n=1 Tax=Nocardioides sp. B-3 TaxID=2895565 RepID=UPI00300E3D7D